MNLNTFDSERPDFSLIVASGWDADAVYYILTASWFHGALKELQQFRHA